MFIHFVVLYLLTAGLSLFAFFVILLNCVWTILSRIEITLLGKKELVALYLSGLWPVYCLLFLYVSLTDCDLC